MKTIVMLGKTLEQSRLRILPLLMEHVCWVRLDGLVIDLGPHGYPE
jgi:hypothetical protein